MWLSQKITLEWLLYALVCILSYPSYTILLRMVKSNYILGTALICVYGVEESEVLTQELHNVFISKIYLWDIDQRASRILKQIFE